MKEVLNLKKPSVLTPTELKALILNNQPLSLKRFPYKTLPVRKVRVTLVGVNEQETECEDVINVTLSYVLTDNVTKKSYLFEDKIINVDRYDLVSNYLGVDVEIYPGDEGGLAPKVSFSDLIGSVFGASVFYTVTPRGIRSKLKLDRVIYSSVKNKKF